MIQDQDSRLKSGIKTSWDGPNYLEPTVYYIVGKAHVRFWKSGFRRCTKNQHKMKTCCLPLFNLVTSLFKLGRSTWIVFTKEEEETASSVPDIACKSDVYSSQVFFVILYLYCIIKYFTIARTSRANFSFFIFVKGGALKIFRKKCDWLSVLLLLITQKTVHICIIQYITMSACVRACM